MGVLHPVRDSMSAG